MKLSQGKDGIPLVKSTVQRDLLFPTPATHQRVDNLEVGSTERWDGVAWVSGQAIPTDDRTTSSLSTLLENNIGKIYNPADYGASPSASPATNAAAIQTAILKSLGITSLSEQVDAFRGGTVMIYERYPITTVFLPRYTQLIGANDQCGFTSTTDAPMLVLGRSLGETEWMEIALSNLILSGDTTKTSQHAICGQWSGASVYAYPFRMENVRVQDVGGDGIKITNDNIAGMMLKTFWSNVEVIRAQGYAVHLKIPILNAFLCQNSRFNNCGNGFFVEDFGSGTTNVEAMRFQNVQFESLGDPTGAGSFATGSFGFKSTQYEGQYAFDNCYFEANGNKSGDTTGANIWVKSAWDLEITGGINVSSNNLVYLKEGGRARVRGQFLNGNTNNTAIFTLDGPPPGTGYSDLEIGVNMWGTDAITDSTLVRRLNSPTTRVRGFTSPKSQYLHTPPRTTLQVFRDNPGTTADAGAIGYSAVKRLANNSGGSTTIAVDAIATICLDPVNVEVTVTEYNASLMAKFLFTSGGGITKFAERGTSFSVTKDNASTINVYHDAGLGAFVVQNKTAGSILVAVRFAGCEPMEHADDGYYETQFA